MFTRTSVAAALAVLVGTSLGLVVVGAHPAAVAAGKPGKPPKPVVTRLAPTSAPTTGGTVVTIKGKHLKTAKKVLFGTAKGTKLKVKSDRKLTVVAPAHVAGAVDVVVKTKGGRSAKRRVTRFTYLAATPQVATISPASGPSTGGTRVTVTGSGFVGVTGVTFGGTPGTSVAVTSPTTLQVTSPEHAAGVVHLNVSTAAGSSPSTTADSFHYLPAPRAMTVQPPAGAAANPGVSLRGVSCPAELQCFAVGSYEVAGGVTVPLVERRTGVSSWAPTTLGLPSDANVAQDAGLLDVDCVSASFCVAVGTYVAVGGKTKALVEVWNGAAWTPAAPFAMPANDGGTGVELLRDVDCASTTMCVAVGTYEDDGGAQWHRGLAVRLAGTTWTSEEIAVDTADIRTEVAAVDCPTPTMCALVGERTENFAGIQYAFASVFNGTAWNPVTVIVALADPDPNANPRARLEAVSCQSASSCTALGTYKDLGKHLAFAAFGPTSPFGQFGTAPLPLPAGLAADPDVHLSSVACASSCAGVGTVALSSGVHVPLLVRTQGTGVATELGVLPAPTAPAGLEATTMESVACLGGGPCLGVGSYRDSPTSAQPLVSTLSGVTWLTARGPLDVAAPTQLALHDVAMDAGVGVAVGSVRSGGVDLGLIIMDLH